MKMEKILKHKNRIFTSLYKIKKGCPEQVIIIESPNGSVSVKLKDSLIYEGAGGEIVIDAE